MNEFLTGSVFFCVILSLICYEIGLLIRKKTGFLLANPVLISVLLIVGFLLLFHVDYEVYEEGTRYMSFFLTPATISLAVPLYRRLELVKKYPAAILGGVLAGVLTAVVSIFLMSLAFRLTHEQYVTLLPKSVSTALGLGISEKMGGIVPLTVVAISISGIGGNIFAELILKVFRIKEPIAKGLAIGTASHAMGTTKAMELGEVEGAMSGLAIVIAGIFTVAAAGLFANFL